MVTVEIGMHSNKSLEFGYSSCPARAAHTHARTGVQLNVRDLFSRPILTTLGHSADSG